MVLVFNTLIFSWGKYLEYRQLQAIKLPQPPPTLRGEYEEEDYRKTQAYQIDKWWFGFFSSTFSFCLSFALFAGGWLPYLWDKCMGLVALAGLDPKNEIAVTIVFFLLDTAKDMLLIRMPLDLYSTFVVEQQHGFNRQSLGLFFLDTVKQAALMLVLGSPVVGAVTWILLHTGPFLALYLWAFLFALSMIMLTVYPIFIAPLFNKFEPLQPGTLRIAIEKLAGSLNFPLTQLYVIDGSTRSAHSNAYMYGFWKNKRIVLFDTLIEQCSREEILAVLAHELGHWKLNHTLMNLLWGQINMLGTFSLFTMVRNTPDLFRSFGFKTQRPAFVAFILFNYISGPIDEIMSLVTNIISRRFEFQADEFAVRLGKSAELRRALVKLDRKNRSACNVDPWYSAYHYSHPPLEERLRGIEVAYRKMK